MCQKQQNRNLFSLFKYYSCEGCTKKIQDEEIKIGINTIYLYHINMQCFVEAEDSFFYFNRKLQQLLYECITLKPPVLLWLDDFGLVENDVGLFDILFELSQQIYIILF